MLSRRVVTARPLSRLLRPTATQSPILSQQRHASSAAEELDPEITDPNMNGGYINPPREKRQFRDPYGDWWYKQQRKNYGEPLHEDDDVLGMFSPEEYTWVKPGFGGLLFGTFCAAFAGVCGVVYMYYPDKPSVPRTFPGGLDTELGGKGSLRARQEGDEEGVRAVSNI